jgi:hypothetical protein
MSRSRCFYAWWLAALVAACGCGGNGGDKPGDQVSEDGGKGGAPTPEDKGQGRGKPADRGPKEKGNNGGQPRNIGPLADPKTAIAYQLGLLKAGDVNRLRACFTPRLRSRITPEAVDKARQEAAQLTADDLVGSVEMGEYKGKEYKGRKTAKIKMENGRTLTLLVLFGDQWLADTKWFRQQWPGR